VSRRPDPRRGGRARGADLYRLSGARSGCSIAGGEWEDGVTRDGNLVTGQAWPDHPEWLAQFLECLGTDIDHAEPAAADD